MGYQRRVHGSLVTTSSLSAPPTSAMDAIRKKMQSLKGETDSLYKTIAGFEEATKEASDRADKADCDIRDFGKKVQQLEIGFDETNDKLTKANESLEEADKQFKEVESDVSALTRRIMLMKEDKKAAEQLCATVSKLALTSKAADNVMKTIKVVENVCLDNEVTIEELDKNLRATVKMASDNEQKLDELSRKLGVQELETVGDNMKQLEKSAEKALEREEKLVEKIYNLQSKYKTTEARFEYGEMNITKLNQR